MHDDHATALWKVTLAWIGALVGSVTLSQVAIVLTIVFTVLQIWKLLREWRRERRQDQLDAARRAREAGL